MSTPVFITLALVAFYVGVTLTFLNRGDTREAPLPAKVRLPIQQASR